MSEIITLPIEDIKIDISMDPRLGEKRDHDVVEGYSQNIDKLPPIVIDQDNHIIDGVHRYRAHLLAGKDTIQVKRQVMQDEGEAFIASVEANSKHGESLKPRHRRKAARRLYEQYGFPNDVIEEVVKRGPSTVAKWLSDLKDEWKAYVRKTAYFLYEGTDEYVDKAASKVIRKREWSQREIAEHLSGPRKKQIGTRRLRDFIEHRRDELKAEKDALEEAECLAEEARLEAQQEREARAAEDARVAEERAQATQQYEDVADVAADEVTADEPAAPTEDTDTADIATDADVDPPPASESESLDEPADYVEGAEGQADDQPATAEEPAPESDIPAQPTADEAEGDGQKKAKTAADRDKTRDHTENLHMLLWLGEKMGLGLWLAKDNRNKEYDGKELSSFRILPSLPAQKYGEALETIQRIDVMWIKDNNIVAAFEVEESTGVSSGLLRLFDLKIVLPGPELYIVSKNYSLRKVKREINRPSFKKIGLSEHCRYILYGLLVDKYNEVKQSSSPPDDWRQILDGIAEELL